MKPTFTSHTAVVPGEAGGTGSDSVGIMREATGSVALIQCYMRFNNAPNTFVHLCSTCFT